MGAMHGTTKQFRSKLGNYTFQMSKIHYVSVFINNPSLIFSSHQLSVSLIFTTSLTYFRNILDYFYNITSKLLVNREFIYHATYMLNP